MEDNETAYGYMHASKPIQVSRIALAAPKFFRGVYQINYGKTHSQNTIENIE